MKKEIGLYVHVPFCVRKCAYCDFASFAGREQDEEQYVDAVLREAEVRTLPDAAVATLYIGGGTPSLLPPALVGPSEADFAQRLPELSLEISVSARLSHSSDKR